MREGKTFWRRSAAKNARKKAETLCAAIGAKVGSLVRIDYNWGEINIYKYFKIVRPEQQKIVLRLTDRADFSETYRKRCNFRCGTAT